MSSIDQLETNKVPARWAHRIAVDASGCWLWTGSIDATGYGKVQEKPYKSHKAHRVVYEASGRRIPEGLVLDHLCRVRKCVNPNHLEPVTDEENRARGFGIVAVNVRKTHCVRDHAFTPENTSIVNKHSRRCLTCQRERMRRTRAAARVSRGGAG